MNHNEMFYGRLNVQNKFANADMAAVINPFLSFGWFVNIYFVFILLYGLIIHEKMTSPCFGQAPDIMPAISLLLNELWRMR